MSEFKYFVRHKLWPKLKEEDGANNVLILLILSAALMVIPILIDFSMVHYTRRTAQTGSDAAVQAAAKDYARALSITWVGFCNEPAPSVVGRYWTTHVLPIGWSPLGAASAYQYASTNRSQLTQYRNYFIPRSKIVDTIPIQFIEIYGETQKDVNNLVNYGQNLRTPSEATSNVYLDRVEKWTIPCGWSGVLYRYRFHWKIALVN